jgi:hypothetical protein
MEQSILKLELHSGDSEAIQKLSSEKIKTGKTK